MENALMFVIKSFIGVKTQSRQAFRRTISVIVSFSQLSSWLFFVIIQPFNKSGIIVFQTIQKKGILPIFKKYIQHI